MNYDGSQNMPLTSNSVADIQARFSPDGTKIVFVFTMNFNLEICTMNHDGAGVMRLTTNTSAEYSPSFSPDGTKIVFSSDREFGGGTSEIFVMNADGRNQTRLTFDGSSALN